MTQNSQQLEDFHKYCLEHPEQRFWQALRNWAGVDKIFITETLTLDTFTFEGRNR